MGLNVSASTGFENKDFLKSTARNILTNGGASNEAASKIIDATHFERANAIYPELSVLRAATQITVNTTLNETLRYLKSHANQKSKKTPVFGELWNIFSVNNEASEENPYKGELYDFKIDDNTKNIFAA